MSADRPGRADVPEVCPHCGQRLSPWQQVLLSVDRALMCKNCWYRIHLDKRDESDRPPDLTKPSTPGTKG